MGHSVNPDREYRLLQQQLDRNVTGAPESPVFMKILKLLYSPEEAELARQLPMRPKSLDVIARKLGMPKDEICDKLTELAQKGLVLDLEVKRKRYFALPPVVIGLFEFTFMRTGDDVPLAELSHLFHEYMQGDDKFARSVFQGKTQIGRSLVREEALPQGDHIEILDWERASHIIKSSSKISVSLCSCRHKASHLGKSCGRPLDNCLSFGHSADMLIRSHLAKPATIDEAMRILEESKQNGLAQTGDNVQRRVSYICNCCGCCCAMMSAIKTFNIKNAIVTSNWIREIDLSKCKGCGKCAKVCPIDAIEIKEEQVEDKKRRWAVCDDSLCLGCGVCYPACKSGAISMKPREKRVFTPESSFDRVVNMAIERGKLASILFDEPDKLNHRALGRIVGVLEKSPPFKAAMAIEPLRSSFLNTVVKAAKRK